jgi:hypothetical protein
MQALAHPELGANGPRTSRRAQRALQQGPARLQKPTVVVKVGSEAANVSPHRQY